MNNSPIRSTKANPIDLAYSLTSKNNAIGNHSFVNKLRDKTYADKLHETEPEPVKKKLKSLKAKPNTPPAKIFIPASPVGSNVYMDKWAEDKKTKSPNANSLIESLEKGLFKQFYVNFTKEHPGRAIEMLKNDIKLKEK